MNNIFVIDREFPGKYRREVRNGKPCDVFSLHYFLPKIFVRYPTTKNNSNQSDRWKPVMPMASEKRQTQKGRCCRLQATDDHLAQCYSQG